jgi:hypothetical protein
VCPNNVVRSSNHKTTVENEPEVQGTHGGDEGIALFSLRHTRMIIRSEQRLMTISCYTAYSIVKRHIYSEHVHFCFKELFVPITPITPSILHIVHHAL